MSKLTLKRMGTIFALMMVMLVGFFMMATQTVLAEEVIFNVDAELEGISLDAVPQQDTYNALVTVENQNDFEQSGYVDALLGLKDEDADPDDPVPYIVLAGSDEAVPITIPANSSKQVSVPLTLYKEEVTDTGAWDTVIKGVLAAVFFETIEDEDYFIATVEKDATLKEPVKEEKTPEVAPAKSTVTGKAPKTGETSVPFAPVAALVLMGIGAAAVFTSKKEMNK